MRVSHSSGVWGIAPLAASLAAAWPAKVGISVVPMAAIAGTEAKASAKVTSFSFMTIPFF
jgi:hypothetical protein